jgi:hypothetical protein
VSATPAAATGVPPTDTELLIRGSS